MPWICPICKRFSYSCLWGCLHLCWCSTFCSCIHVFMRCFQRLNCFTTNFCHQKLVKSHVRNERSDQTRPGIRGGCGGLTSFFPGARKPLLLVVSSWRAQWQKVPQKSASLSCHCFPCFFIDVSTNRIVQTEFYCSYRIVQTEWSIQNCPNRID